MTIEAACGCLARADESLPPVRSVWHADDRVAGLLSLPAPPGGRRRGDHPSRGKSHEKPMTFALIRYGKIVDYTHADTFEELAGWCGTWQRTGDEVVLLDVAPGEEVRVGDPVHVVEHRIPIATVRR
ncbi:MAG: hypothetical protein AB1689_19445 [Thermodesulfobacteriota bacterium]